MILNAKLGLSLRAQYIKVHTALIIDLRLTIVLKICNQIKALANFKCPKMGSSFIFVQSMYFKLAVSSENVSQIEFYMEVAFL